MSLFGKKKKEKESNVAISPPREPSHEAVTKSAILYVIWNILSITLYSCYMFFVIYHLSSKNFLAKIIPYLCPSVCAFAFDEPGKSQETQTPTEKLSKCNKVFEIFNPNNQLRAVNCDRSECADYHRHNRYVRGAVCSAVILYHFGVHCGGNYQNHYPQKPAYHQV